MLANDALDRTVATVIAQALEAVPKYEPTDRAEFLGHYERIVIELIDSLSAQLDADAQRVLFCESLYRFAMAKSFDVLGTHDSPWSPQRGAVPEVSTFGPSL